MKKKWIFIFSTILAFSIAYFSKVKTNMASVAQEDWKTFEKIKNNDIVNHLSTANELEKAKIPTIKREIATMSSPLGILQKNAKKKLPTDTNYYVREDRILIGDLINHDYQDEKTELEMINKINPDWKEILGNDLLRFQEEETKVMIKEEYSVIKVQNGKGQYLEQVSIRYLLKNGNSSSFKALIDSETGFVTETWDRTLNEATKSSQISFPLENNSGIISR